MREMFHTPQARPKPSRLPTIQLLQNTAQAITNNSSQAMIWDTLDFDDVGGLWVKGEPTIIAVTQPFRWVRFRFRVAYQSTGLSNVTQNRVFNTRNSVYVTELTKWTFQQNFNAASMASWHWVSCQQGDKFRLDTYQNFGSTQNTAGNVAADGPSWWSAEFDT